MQRFRTSILVALLAAVGCRSQSSSAVASASRSTHATNADSPPRPAGMPLLVVHLSPRSCVSLIRQAQALQQLTRESPNLVHVTTLVEPAATERETTAFVSFISRTCDDVRLDSTSSQDRATPRPKPFVLLDPAGQVIGAYEMMRTETERAAFVEDIRQKCIAVGPH